MKWIRACGADSVTEQCVEAALVEGGIDSGRVLVRNSTNPMSVVSFDVDEWRTFLTGVRETREFDF